MNKKIIIPITGIIVIFLSLIAYFICAFFGYIQNPFFDSHYQKTQKNINISKNIPQKKEIHAPIKKWDPNSTPITYDQIAQTVEQKLQLLNTYSSFTSLTIKDPFTNKILYSLNGEKAMPVASSTKILSAIANLQTLKPNYRFTTETRIDKKNNLYIKSNGDILLNPNHTDISSQTQYAGLLTLAENTAKILQKKHITTVNLKIDDTYMGNEKTLPDWEKYDLQTNVGLVTSIAINKMLTPDQNAFDTDPTQNIKNTFAQHLANLGINVQNMQTQVHTPKNTKLVGKIHSDTIKNITKTTLKNSDNTMIEVLTRAGAMHDKYNNTFTATTKYIINKLRSLKIDTKNLKLRDASGLSPENKVTTNTLVDALTKVSKDEKNIYSIIDDLPIAGTDGTLQNRFTQIPGKILAKTGTLTDTSSLSGIMYTRTGRTLIFSVNTHGYNKNNTWQVRTILDNLITDIQNL